MGRPAPRLWGASEIIDYLGVSRQWFENLSVRADFPKPALTLKAGRLWWIDDIERWQAERQRRITD